MSMPVTGTISQAKDSQSGKTLGVLINGQWYSTKNWELREAVGKTITFTPSQSEYKGTTYLFLNEYTSGTVGTTHPSENSPEKARQDTAFSDELSPRDCLPMTSNIVAHAIAAGLIKSTTDLNQWAATAFTVVRSLTASNSNTDDDGFDDDIPF